VRGKGGGMVLGTPGFTPAIHDPTTQKPMARQKGSIKRLKKS